MNNGKEKLQELFDNKIPVYSFSKLGSYSNCQYEYYKSYVLREKGGQNVYSFMGGAIHEAIQAVHDDGKSKEHVKDVFYETLGEANTLGLKFPNKSIRESWVNSMSDFVDNFEPFNTKILSEKFIVFEILPGIWMQMYLDVIKPTEERPIVDIIDWKTSSKFVGKKKSSAGRQLLLYKLGLEATTPFKVKDTMWNMLKYKNVNWQQQLKSKKMSNKSKMVERGKWVKEMRNNLEKDLKDRDDVAEFEIEILLDEAVQNNNLDGMPKDIQEKYSFSDAYVSYEASEENIEDVKNYVKDTIAEIESKDKKDESVWEPIEITEQTSFYCANLCNHRKSCKHYKAFLDKANFKKEDKKLEFNEVDDDFYKLFS